MIQSSKDTNLYDILCLPKHEVELLGILAMTED